MPEYAAARIASVRVSRAQKHGQGPQQNQEIQRKAGICGVPEIAFEAVAHQVDRERFAAIAVDLTQPVRPGFTCWPT